MSFPRSGFGLLVALVSVGFAGCAGGPDPDTAAPSHMYAHYNQVGEIQAAVIDGNVDATRGPARWLASHEGEEFPAAAQDALEMMRAEARIILAQREITDIARSVARMGNACAECHRVTDGGPTIRVEETPGSTADPSPHMLRHVWAMDRLWEGLIAPSDGAWNAGAGALMGAAVDFEAPGAQPSQAQALADEVHTLGESARGVQDPKERVQIYGRLLQTCVLCHEVLDLKR